LSSDTRKCMSAFPNGSVWRDVPPENAGAMAEEGKSHPDGAIGDTFTRYEREGAKLKRGFRFSRIDENVRGGAGGGSATHEKTSDVIARKGSPLLWGVPQRGRTVH